MSQQAIDSFVARSEQSGGLRRTLTTLNVTLLGVGGVIGAGIFVLTGHAAAEHAGPAIVLSFILSAIGCTFAALCYAEMAAMIPVAGSAYTYAYATMGRLIAWIIGWDLILEYLFGSATVAVGWAGYVNSFLTDVGFPIPAALATSPLKYVMGEGWVATGAICNLPAMVIVAACTVLMVRGTRESAMANNFVVLIKVGIILAFIGAGAQYVKMSNLTPFIPPNTGVFGEFGWSGIARGAGVIFFAFIGFDSLSTLAQEAKDPQRSMPIGIIATLLICTVLYVGVSIVMTGIVPYQQLNDPAPIAVAINAAGEGMAWLRPLIKLAAIAGLSSVVLVMMLGQPRIFYAMAQDGMLPGIFAKVHPRFGTPHVSSIMCGIVAAIVAGIVPISILGELVSIGTLLAFVIVCAGVWVLRRTDAARARPFRTPWVPFVPIMGILVSVLQMAALPLDTWLRLIIWMGIGFVLYFTYSRRRAVEHK